MYICSIFHLLFVFTFLITTTITWKGL